MKKLIIKSCLYIFLVLLFLEGIVRIFHLYNELPIEYVAEDGIVKWIPEQMGITVYGNRIQHFSEYRINKMGYNSYKEFKPSKDKFELALLGDSYIEGFHQNYKNSIGKKIEAGLKDIDVYEFGHSANDFADQMYLLYKNKDYFNLINHLIIRVKYEKDLIRGDYKFYEKEPFFPLLRKSKLAVYLLNIGITDPLKKLHRNVMQVKGKLFGNNFNNEQKEKSKKEIDNIYLSNFKKLTSKYNFDKNKITLLIDSRATSEMFLNYLDKTGINYIDYSLTFEKNNSKPQTLIYDAHWNNYGRTLIANDIITYLTNNEIFKE